MKRYLFTIFLISVSFFNVGFKHQNNAIVGIVCGDQEFFKNLKESFLQKNLYKKFKEITEIYGFTWIFNKNTGQIFSYERYSDSFKPFNEEKSLSGEITYKYQAQREENKMIFKSQGYDQNNNKYETEAIEVFNFDDMSYKSEFDGKKYEDQCEYFPIPKEVNVQS